MKHYFILDACTIINILKIDEDDILFKMINTNELKIAEEVITEVNKNKNARFSKGEISSVESRLTYFRSKTIQNNILKKDLGSSFSDIRKLVAYSKKDNGELYSTALALYLSRVENTKLYFYTDDFPAKETFSKVFEYQQIGQILDSVDLLTHLYWSTSNFSFNDYKRFLTSLFHEYFKEIVELLTKLERFKDGLSLLLRRNKEFITNLNILINILRTHQFDNLSEPLSFFASKRWKASNISKLLKHYPTIYKLGTEKKRNLAQKLIETTKRVDKFEILKIA